MNNERHNKRSVAIFDSRYFRFGENGSSSQAQKTWWLSSAGTTCVCLCTVRDNCWTTRWPAWGPRSKFDTRCQRSTGDRGHAVWNCFDISANWMRGWNIHQRDRHKHFRIALRRGERLPRLCVPNKKDVCWTSMHLRKPVVVCIIFRRSRSREPIVVQQPTEIVGSIL